MLKTLKSTWRKLATFALMLKLKRISLISIGISATLATLLVLVDAVQFVLTVVTKVIKLYIQGRATSFAIAETRDDARA